MQSRAAQLGLNVPRFLYGSMRRSLGLPTRPEGAAAELASGLQALPPLPAAATLAHPVPAAAEMEAADEPADTDPTPEPASPPEHAPEVAREKGRAFEFAVQTLRMSPDITYQDLRARARMAEMDVPPIVYGRAKALLGLVPTRPRRPRAEPPRMLRQVDSAAEVDRLPALDGIRSLEQLVQTVRTLEQERQLLRAALAAIQQTVQDALADG